MKIFVSHAVSDYDIVKDFFYLLITGTGIPRKNIFCTLSSTNSTLEEQLCERSIWN